MQMDNFDKTASKDSSSNKKARGRTTMESFRTNFERSQLDLEYNEVGVAINDAAVKMTSLEGALVRSMIPINIKTWKDVSSGLKDILWDSIKVIKCLFPYIIKFVHICIVNNS
jgi:hypothetical protein